MAELGAARRERHGALGGLAAAAAGGAFNVLLSLTPSAAVRQRLQHGVQTVSAIAPSPQPSGESECVRALADARRAFVISLG